MATRAEIMARPKYAVAKYGAKPTADNKITNRLVDEGKLPEKEREIYSQARPNLTYNQFQEEKRGIGPGRTKTLTEPLPVTPTTTANRTESLTTATPNPLTELGGSSFVKDPELERLGMSIASGFKSPGDLTPEEKARLENYLLDKQMNSANYDPVAAAEKQGQTLTDYYKGLEEDRRREYEEEKKRREREDQRALDRYSAQLDQIYAPQFTQAQKAGEAREEDFRRDTGFRGFTRSGYLAEGVQNIEADTQAEVSKIEALRAADLAYRQAQLEGATGKVLQALRSNIESARTAVEEQQYDNFIKQEELRAQAVAAGDTATLNMINALAAGSDLAGIDWETSAANGYLIDQNGNIFTNNAGTPQEYNPYDFKTVGGALYKVDRQGNASLVVGKSGGGGSGSGASSDAINFYADAIQRGEIGLLDIPSVGERNSVQKVLANRKKEFAYPQQQPSYVLPKLDKDMTLLEEYDQFQNEIKRRALAEEEE